MIDVKKLVTGFLILAVAVGATALAISTIGSSAGANNLADVNAASVPDQTQPTTALGGNAFLPQTNTAGDQTSFVPDDPSADAAIASTTEAIANDPNNLTNILANTYLNNLAVTNPDGATLDSNGNPTMTPPDSSSVIEEFMSSSTNVNFQIPDWDKEVAEIPIEITSSTPSALATYGAALGEILGENVATPALQDMLNNNSDPSFEPFVTAKVQTTLQDISGLKTPASVVSLQRSLIKTLVYTKNDLALAENASADPLKTELIIEGEDAEYQAAIQDLQTQVQNAQSANLFSFENNPAQPKNNVLASLQSLFGIPVANAQLAVYDPVAHTILWANLAKLIENQLKSTVLQIIKNTIVFLMQKTIFSAIKGSGAPAFIQQWGLTLANAFQQSALNALNSQMACVGAAPFAAQLRLTLNATYQPNKNICAVQFQSQLGNNLTSFYKDFSNGGGWVTFGQTLKPDNNYFGSAFFIAQTVGQSAQNGQNSAQAKATASQGFRGSAVCDDGSNPGGESVDCVDAVGDTYYGNANGTCPSGYIAIGMSPNNGLCSDGTEPQIQTPGAVLNSMVGSAVDGNFKLITSANDWAGLASGLFVSILQETLNSLSQTTIADANGLLQQASAGGGATSVSSNGLSVTSGASSPQTMTCYVEPDVSGNPLAAVIQVSGGEVITSTGISTPTYSWTPPAVGIISTTIGDSVEATFNATGTYSIVVNDTTDNASTTCQVVIPVPAQ